MAASPTRVVWWIDRVLKPLIWVAALTPAALLVLGALRGDLGVDPVETLTLKTGNTALILLLCTLAVSPVRRLTGIQHLVRARRLLGLFAFAYALMHFAVYAIIDQGLSLDYVWEDIAERPYITVGTAALLLMLPLAITSTRGWIRRLGRRWQLLHRLIYVSAGLAVLHFTWAMKADIREPLTYAAILAALLATRLPPVRRLIQRARLPSRRGSSARGPASEVGAVAGATADAAGGALYPLR